jgi:Holliday junction DNA helicase RuvA
MIHRVQGTLLAKRENFLVVETSGGISLRVFASPHTLSALPATGSPVTLHTYLHVREDALELYGFLHESELDLFEKLISVSGIGPKSGMGILGVAKADQLIAAINEGRTELITRASGIGRKTAERVILELKGKLAALGTAQETLNLMESDVELEETLMSLGYSKAQSKTAIAKLDPKITSFKERLKEALKRTKG